MPDVLGVPNTDPGAEIPMQLPATNTPTAYHEREILQSYLDDIFDTPVLETGHQNKLFLEMETAEAGLREALSEIPPVAEALLERWNERRARGRVTGALSRHCLLYTSPSPRDRG